MSTFTINSGKTIRNKIVGIAALSLGVVISYYGITGLNTYRKENSFDNNWAELKSMVDTGTVQAAQETYERLVANDGLRPGDKLVAEKKLREKVRTIEKTKNRKDMLSKINISLNTGETDRATLFLEALVDSGFTTDAEQEELSKKIYDCTDNGSYQIFLSADSKSKLGMGQNYIRLHPRGTHAKDVSKMILNESLNEFVQKSQIVFNETYATLQALNEVLGNNTTVSKSLGSKETLSKIESFRAKVPGLYLVDNNKTIENGNNVKTVSFPGSTFSEQYLAEREKNAQTGTTGKVVGSTPYKGKSAYFVQFEGKDFSWKTDWGMISDFWEKYETKSIAVYFREELSVVKKISSDDANLITKELDKMAGYLK